jgi:hypothetical protein
MTGFDDEDIAAYYVFMSLLQMLPFSFLWYLMVELSAHAVYSLCQG